MFRFEKNGTKVECDTADELSSALSGASSNGPAAARAPKARRGGQKNAMTKQWDAARKMAADENITVAQARAKIAKLRKAAKS